LHHVTVLVDQPQVTKPGSDTACTSFMHGSQSVDRLTVHKSIIKLTIFLDAPCLALPLMNDRAGLGFTHAAEPK
jgi:hypothetical protein